MTSEKPIEEKSTGELQVGYYNATKVTHDEQKAERIEAELNSRDYWNVQQNERYNPTWVYKGH